MTTANLLALLRAQDAVGQLATLEGFPEKPQWANRSTDAAIGNFVAALVGADRERCVRAGLAAVEVVAPHLPPDSEESLLTHEWLAVQIGSLKGWLAAPTAENQKLYGGDYDATRQTAAWKDFDVVDAWIAEASDFAVHAIWSGAFKHYATPPAPQSCAALCAVCATRALILDGVEANAAVLEIAKAVAAAMPDPP